MSGFRLLKEVARWEFRRWYKVRDQLMTLTISSVMGLAIWGGIALFSRSSDTEVRLAVINGEALPLELASGSTLSLVPWDESPEAARDALGRDELDAILTVARPDAVELAADTPPLWLPELQAALDAARRAQVITAAELPAGLLQDIDRPVGIEMVLVGEGPSGPGRITAMVLIGLMLMGVMLGLGYQFGAITGEKQLRVTEQIVSAITPQTWIDGKILGISLVSIASLFTYVVGVLLFLVVGRLFGRGTPIPLGWADPGLLIPVMILGFLGFLFWNTFFAAIAATINDPNTSARSSLLIVPLLPLALAFFGLGDPDAIWFRILGVFPLTSTGVMPTRLLLTEVPIWEIAAAIVLLILATWLIRNAAGRIFALGILMYGKEPTFGEMFQQMRRNPTAGS